MRLTLLPALAAATAALSACTAPPSSAVSVVDRAGEPFVSYADPDARDQPRLLREVALRTPIEIVPGRTGAPPARPFGTGMTVGAADLVAAGADISPDMRVWTVRTPTRVDQVFGPPPGVRAD